MSPARSLCAFALAMLVATGCSNKPAEHQPPAAAAAPPPAPAAPVSAPPVARAPAPSPAAAPAAPVGIPADFPRECVAYAALIDKLKACDKLGGARDGLAQGYASLRAAWSAVPQDRRAEVATQCKTQADSLRNAAAATCGW